MACAYRTPCMGLRKEDNEQTSVSATPVIHWFSQFSNCAERKKGGLAEITK